VNPLVSILVATYNAENFIGEALESCICQTYSPVEIIVVNDGSKDNTEKIAMAYAAKDARIKVFSQSNSGVIATRNRSINIAKGEWAIILDGDDVLLPQAIEEQMQYIGKYPDVVVLSAWSEDIGENSKTFRLHKFPDDLSTPSQFKAYKQAGKLIEHVRHSGTIFRRSMVANMGGYTHGQILEDLYLWNQLVGMGYMMLVNPMVLSKYRFHNNSIMSKKAYDAHVNYKWITSHLSKKDKNQEPLMSFEDYKQWYKKQSWVTRLKDIQEVYTGVYSRKVLISMEKKSYINAISQLMALFVINPRIALKKVMSRGKAK
jgi:glycosyltransferase involved in cell wall biosynthesis